MQASRIVALLPFDPARIAGLQAKPWVSRSLPYFSMPPDDLFTALVRGHLFASLFRASAEALVTENAARLALMQQAERPVDDRLDPLWKKNEGAVLEFLAATTAEDISRVTVAALRSRVEAEPGAPAPDPV